MRKWLPLIVIACVIILVNTSYEYVYFGWHTYSEAIFVLLQMVFLWQVSKVFFLNAGKKITLSDTKQWTDMLIVALICLLLALTRSIGYTSVLALIFTFIWFQRFQDLVRYLLCFLLIYGVYKVIIVLAFNDSSIQFGQQSAQFLLKNPYNPTLGHENILGFLSRFKENSVFYLGSAAPMFFGLTIKSKILSTAIASMIWIILIAYFVYGFKRKDNMILFLASYCIISLSVEFILLHDFWKQPRLIMPFFPLIAIILIHLAYFIFKSLYSNQVQIYALVILGTMLLISSVMYSYPKARLNHQIAQLHNKGFKFAGYPKPWQHYLQMSEYVGKNISRQDNILCRKPDLSFIFGKRLFQGLYQFPYAEKIDFTKATHQVIIKAEDFPKLVLMPSMDILRKSIQGFFVGNSSKGDNEFYLPNKYYLILTLSQREFVLMKKLFSIVRFQYDDTLETHDQYLEDISYIELDQLVNVLIDNDITYLMAGSLQGSQDGQVRITSIVEKMSLFLNMKYPDMIELTHSIGDEYPTDLYKVNYAKL